jgi:hypothetical protein
MIKSRRMSLARHVTFMGVMRNAYKIIVCNLKGKDHLRHLVTEVRIILKWISRRYSVGMWTRFIWVMLGFGGGLFCKHCNEPFGSIKGGSFLIS